MVVAMVVVAMGIMVAEAMVTLAMAVFMGFTAAGISGWECSSVPHSDGTTLAHRTTFLPVPECPRRRRFTSSKRAKDMRRSRLTGTTAPNRKPTIHMLRNARANGSACLRSLRLILERT